jgi:hypothetical protein
MKLAIHHQSLLDMLNGHCDFVTTSAVLGSKISITPEVLTNYQNHLSGHLNYQAWFSSASHARRLCLNLPQTAPNSVQITDTTTQGYGTASYFGASTLVADSGALAAPAITSLGNIGVDLISPTAKLDQEHGGDNPFKAIALKANGDLSFDVLDRFIAPEESVVVYDKYINNISIELLEHIASRMRPGAVFRVFHTYKAGGNLLAGSAICARLKAANSAISVFTKTVTPDFARSAHDRYIFLGQRIQLVFSAGLDCFGKVAAATGKRQNRQSAITFFDVTESNPLTIFADDGTSYSVHHYTNV